VKYPFEKTVHSEKETAELAGLYAKEIQAGDVIILNGELGAGKTFFVKQIASVWGIPNITSPSFAIVNSYSGSVVIYHFDFYRIKSQAELFDIGFNDYLNDTNAVIFIEWGNLIPEILPWHRIEINIDILNNSTRKFKFNRYV
jgi:tRNA threonylcarbamoyladenosine biosynthesis protein TsaE